MIISYEFTFQAAHNLISYHGKPEPVHGHQWKCEVSLSSNLDAEGMGVDFIKLKDDVTQKVFNVLDHSNVNDTIPQSTAENVAIWIWEQLSKLPLYSIKVWEAKGCSVSYYGPASKI